MSKSLLRNNSQSPITLPPPYTGIIAPGDAVVLDDPPDVVASEIGIFPELISFLTVTQVPDAQPVDGHDRAAAAAGIVAALGSAESPISVNGQRIIDVGTPTAGSDAATKLYVDNAVAAGGNGTVYSVTSTNDYITVTDSNINPKLTLQVGAGANQVASGTDTRFNVAPGTAGAVVYDNGTGYSKTPVGAVGKVLKAGTGGIPEWAEDSTTPTGPAGGSLAGTYPNPTIAAGVITNDEIAAAAAIATSKLSGALTDITNNGLDAFVNDATKVARTYYVTMDGSDATGNGSLSAPFASIAAALTAAGEVAVGEYVAISVGPGTYTGDVSITRYNTLLLGSGDRPETYSSRIVGSVTVNPAGANNKTGHTVYMTGFFVQPPGASTSPALTITGSGLFQFVATDCYFTTINSNLNATAIYSDVSNASRPRIFLQDCIITTQTAGPSSVVALLRGDARIFRSQVNHGSSVTLGTTATVISVSNDATLWADSVLAESRGDRPVINATTGTSNATRLIISNCNITSAFDGPLAHGVSATNAPALAAFIYQTAFGITSTTGNAIFGTAPSLIVYGDLSFQPGTNSSIASAVTLIPMTEKHGTLNLPSLTASLPLKLDANKTVTAAAIALDGTEVTNTLPINKGGTGISTAPTAGGVVYGGATTQAYSAVGTSGQPLLSGGTGAPSFGSLDLGTAGNVTGVLPKANQGAQDVGGDLSGSTATATVIKLQNNPVKAGVLGAGDAGKALVWSGSEYEPTTITPGGGGGGGGGGLTYYLNYGVAGEAPTPNGSTKELSLTFSDPAAQTAAVTAPNGGVYATLAEFVTPLGEPGATTTPPGIWDVVAYLLSSHTDGVFYRFSVHKWDGTTLSPAIATSENVELTSTSPGPVPYTAEVYVPQTVLTSTERVVIRLEITRTTAAAHTVTGYFGNGHPSHSHTTIGAPGGTGLVKVVDGIIQAPASLLVNADVALDAAIAVSKLDGNAGVGGANKVLHGSALAGDPPTWSAVDLAADVTGTLPVENGGTGLTSGTSGGVPYFSATSTLASSAELAANALVLGGGAGVAPATLGSLGLATQVLHGNASGAPTWAAVDLATSVTGTLPIDKGGTGSNVAPNIGGVIYASSATALASTAVGTTGWLLKSNGAAAPSWLDVVPAANGGTGVSEAAINTVFAGPSTGVGPGAPGFRALVKADLPAATVFTDGSYADPSWITSLSGTKISGDISGNAANVTGTVAVTNGGTGSTTAPTAGGVIYGASTTAFGSTGNGATGQYLKSNNALAPEWADVPYDVAAMVANKPDAAATVFLFRAVRPFSLSSTASDHVFAALTGATGSSDFKVYVNSVAPASLLLTANFASGGSTGPQDATVTMGVASTAIAVGDLILIVAPTLQDATLANIYWTLKGKL